MADPLYDSVTWKRLRRAHLAIEPLCRGCRAAGRLIPANTVDHIIAVKDGGPAFPDHDGLASYCPACHSAKTVRGTEAGAVRSTKPRRGCNPNGSPLDPAHPWYGAKSLKAAATLPCVEISTQLVSRKLKPDG